MADHTKYEMETTSDGEEEMEEDVEDRSGSSDDDSDNEDDDKENELIVSALSKKISQNPYLYDAHKDRIAVLRDISDLHRLRDAREEMSKYFPLTEELWLDWLKDEIPLASDGEERKKVEGLFERALQDYQSVPLWLEYVQFSIGRMGEEDGLALIRDAFERALAAVGLHASQGVNIWEAYREFENAISAGLMPQPGTVVTKEQEEAFTVQNQRVANLFKRQLAVPLVGMDLTLQEYKDWRGEENVSNDIQEAYDKASKLLAEIQTYEDGLLATKAPHLEVYQDYIQVELKSGDPARVQCIYERALKENCLVPDLWLQYTKYLDKLKVKKQINSTYERALRNCPWASQLWANYMLALERQSADFTQMKELADRALVVGFGDASDYLLIWCQYCDYLKRRIDWDKDHTEPLETFRLTIERAADFMFENYGKDGDPEAALQQYWALIEARYCNNMEKAREIWNVIMQGGHGAEAALWLQYYRLERMFGDVKHCRRILQKALNSVTDWPESITQAYINFEREEGDLEQYDTAVARCEAQMERINERRAKAAEKEQALQEAKKKEKPDKKSQKKGKQGTNSDSDTHGQYTGSKASASAGTSGDFGAGDSKHKRKLEDTSLGKGKFADHGPSTKIISKEPVAKKLKTEEADEATQHGESVLHDPSKDNITVFVSNLDFALPEERLREVFQKCGQISNIRLVKNYKGKSKGFGYVEFTESNAVLKALKLDREFVDGRPMFVSRCEDRSVVKPTTQFKYSTKMEKNKLFIKGLPFTITRDALETIFKEHGNVKDIRMVTYRNGSPKGIAFVEYDNEASASQAVLKTNGLQIGEHIISVDISNPPERKTPLSTRMDGPSARLPNLGSGKRETDTRGKARTQVSLVPRAVRQQGTGASSAKLSSSSSSTVKPSSDPGDAKASSSSNGGSAMSNEDFRKMLLNK
ncbi:squamous cell carcinoma antigen recognized by t-cells 3 [Plakobranchus ocellatus]|uniref:Squamous cell carcinoma antigen recognized by t-cells 3 n=1 Tax=Plakobranchus ocellatus TaxID=259542 RepID=A0AAV4CME7_9GAST|nr:squamous cell carcinoma antigen recognized by t-cells 3 [Plakobranchus ocellatus]